MADDNPRRHEDSRADDHGVDEKWKHRAPYRVRQSTEEFEVKWRGSCHCGKVKYQLSRDKPLASKYCHCRTCQRLHGAPFQWAAIFEKEDINFTNGPRGLSWFNSSSNTAEHQLPCKVHCSYCKTPIMDEGRNMILLFPSLIEEVHTEIGREAFKPQMHIFYSQRVVDLPNDGLPKWSEHENSHLIGPLEED
ncbi:hypothetical protein V2G26_012868 [Clonostachys chloroleuca]